MGRCLYVKHHQRLHTVCLVDRIAKIGALQNTVWSWGPELKTRSTSWKSVFMSRIKLQLLTEDLLPVIAADSNRIWPCWTPFNLQGHFLCWFIWCPHFPPLVERVALLLSLLTLAVDIMLSLASHWGVFSQTWILQNLMFSLDLVPMKNNHW